MPDKMNIRQYVDSNGVSTNGASTKYNEHRVISIGIPMKTYLENKEKNGTM